MRFSISLVSLVFLFWLLWFLVAWQCAAAPPHGVIGGAEHQPPAYSPDPIVAYNFNIDGSASHAYADYVGSSNAECWHLTIPSEVIWGCPAWNATGGPNGTGSLQQLTDNSATNGLFVPGSPSIFDGFWDNQAYTFAMDVKTTSWGEDSGFVFVRSTQLQIRQQGSSALTKHDAVVEVSGSDVIGTGSEADGTWHHICYTFDGDTDTAAIVIDGVVDASQTDWTGTIPNSASRVTIATTSSDQELAFEYDNVRIYDIALSADQCGDIAGVEVSGTPSSGGMPCQLPCVLP